MFPVSWEMQVRFVLRHTIRYFWLPDGCFVFFVSFHLFCWSYCSVVVTEVIIYYPDYQPNAHQDINTHSVGQGMKTGCKISWTFLPLSPAELRLLHSQQKWHKEHGESCNTPQQVLAAAASCFSQLPCSTIDPQWAAVWMLLQVLLCCLLLFLFWTSTWFFSCWFFFFFDPFSSLWESLVKGFFCLFSNMVSQRCQLLGCRAQLFPVAGHLEQAQPRPLLSSQRRISILIKK